MGLLRSGWRKYRNQNYDQTKADLVVGILCLTIIFGSIIWTLCDALKGGK